MRRTEVRVTPAQWFHQLSGSITIRMCTTISHEELSGNHGQLFRAAVAMVMRPTKAERAVCVRVITG